MECPGNQPPPSRWPQLDSNFRLHLAALLDERGSGGRARGRCGCLTVPGFVSPSAPIWYLQRECLQHLDEQLDMGLALVARIARCGGPALERVAICGHNYDSKWFCTHSWSGYLQPWSCDPA